MKPTKQTVYLPVKVADESEHIQDIDGYFYKKEEGYFFTPEQLNQLLSDVIKDTLNTGAGSEQ